MPSNYDLITFTRAGSQSVEHGIYLDACTTQSGDYLPQRVIVLHKVHPPQSPLEVLQYGNVSLISIS